MRKLLIFLGLFLTLGLFGQGITVMHTALRPTSGGSSPALYTDDFEGYSTSEDLEDQTDWALGTGNTRIYDPGDEITVTNDGAESIIIYTAGSFANNQYAEVLFDGTTTGSYIGVCVRSSGSGATTNGYSAWADDTNIYVRECTNESFATLDSDATGFTTGDYLKMTITGSEIRCYKNDNLITGLGTAGVITDASISTGSAGVSGSSSGSGTRISSWEGGDL